MQRYTVAQRLWLWLFAQGFAKFRRDASPEREADVSETSNRRLVLHIGAHKTGTSAIQVFLNRAMGKLMEQDWVFAPQPQGHLNWSPMVVMHQTATGGTFRLNEVVLQNLVQRIRARRRHLIVSAEDLFFLDPPEITRFAAEMHKLASDITIISYLRRQDQMALSQWAQGARTIQSAVVFGSEAGQLRPLTDQMRSYLDYSGRLDQWRAAFPQARIITRIYDRRAFAGGDVVRDFLLALGLGVEGVEVPLEVNSAFGTRTVQFYYWLRAQGLSQPEIWAISERKLVEVTQDRALPSRAEAAAFLGAFDASNARLATMLGTERAFDTDMSAYPDVSGFGPLDPEFKLRNLMALTLALRDGLK
jgi:hypothetical protein